MAHDRYSNVTSISSKKDRAQKHDNFLRLAGQLVAENAVNNNASRQRITGDQNVQISSDPVSMQCIQGSGNIQIAVSGADLALVLEQLLRKTALSDTDKKRKSVSDIVSVIQPS
ncbi:hypothetical protein [Paracandidimonas soli]|uniref:Uncharacterized protein n=1 Tax=Paracandidimonas soli TaxID=1917182 RepID=A0A4R3VAK8_9BURK|nr:hypothetical protein [Paracandidimonas soli]TCV00529.1 hypothetical protein EV686_103109 [Paracandidimonas soli]